MASQILIRDAHADDSAAIARMCRALAVVTGVDGGVPMTAERVTRDLIEGAHLSLLSGVVDGRVRGYALYSVAYETAWSARGLYLSDLFVAEDARRCGLARAFMAELVRRAKASGGSFVWWMTKPGNRQAEAFYASLGAHAEPLSAMVIHTEAFEALIGERK
ncbi:MAG: GNAT family N-acetyltransferase [Pseudomonadota bacterium]